MAPVGGNAPQPDETDPYGKTPRQNIVSPKIRPLVTLLRLIMACYVTSGVSKSCFALTMTDCAMPMPCDSGLCALYRKRTCIMSCQRVLPSLEQRLRLLPRNYAGSHALSNWAWFETVKGYSVSAAGAAQ